MFADVADQAQDIPGDEPPDGAAGVHADDDPACWVEHEAGRLRVARVGVDERAGRLGDGVGAVADREPQVMLGDQVPRGGGPCMGR